MRDKFGKRTHGKAYTYHGKTQYLTKWSEELGIPRNILSVRLAKGWDIERAFEQPVKTDRKAKVEYNGKTYSYAELSRIFGNPVSRISYRLQHDYSVKDALSSKDFRHMDRTHVYASQRPELCTYPDCDRCQYEDCVAG